MSKDEDGYVSPEQKGYAYEVTDPNGNNPPPTKEEAEAKLVDLLTKLKSKIKEFFANSNKQFPKFAYENVDKFPQVIYGDILMANGGYANRVITITPLGISKDNEGDIISTIYHEYMHYLNDINGFLPYRRDSDGSPFQLKIECFKERYESDKEFYDRILDYYAFANWSIDLPMDYEDCTKELLASLDEFAKNKGYTREKSCFEYIYRPSNFYRDEINAYTETEYALNMGLFDISIEKLNRDKENKSYYSMRLENAIKYEQDNNYNASGYENK
jgi:hypothetical protein